MNEPKVSARQARPLAAVLRDAAAELALQQPPAELAARVRAAALSMQSVQAAPRAPPRAHWGAGPRVAWTGAGAVAFATVTLGSALLLLRPPAPVLVDDGVRFGSFVRVAPPERWPAGDAQAWLVRTELPGERLAALGLPYDPTRAGDTVRAELLMRGSGEVLAVRFVP